MCASLDEIGDALVFLGDHQQLRSNLGKSEPRRLLPKSRCLRPIAVRVGKTGMRYPPPRTHRLGSVALGQRLISLARFFAFSRSLPSLYWKPAGTPRHCGLTPQIVHRCLTVNTIGGAVARLKSVRK